MIGRRFKQLKSLEGRLAELKSLEERLAEDANRLRGEAKALPPGAAQEALIRKARECETDSHMSAWLSSSGLQPPTR